MATVTIELEEYNELLKAKNAFDKNQIRVMTTRYDYEHIHKDISYCTESEVVDDMNSKIDNLVIKLDDTRDRCIDEFKELTVREFRRWKKRQK